MSAAHEPFFNINDEFIMKKFILTALAALTITAHAGEPIAPNPPASPVPLPYGCAQKSNDASDMLSPDFGCAVMRQAASKDTMSDFDQAVFLHGMQLRQNALILEEVRAIREHLDAGKRGAK